MTTRRKPFRVRRGMVGHEAGVEARLLGCLGALHHRLAGDEVVGSGHVVSRQPDREAQRHGVRG